jgi:hypothetical protein
LPHQAWLALPEDAASFPKHNFSALLTVMARVCRLAPTCVRLLWATPALKSFLALDVDRAAYAHSPLLPHYVNLLDALCLPRNTEGGGSDGGRVVGCADVYDLVKASARLKWSTVFALLREARARYAGDNGNDNRNGGGGGGGYDGEYIGERQSGPVTAGDATLIASLLTLLRAVMRNVKIQKTLCGSSDFRFFELLFGLLSCRRFSPALRSQVLQTLAACAAGSAELAGEVRSITLASVNHARLCQSRSLMAITLASVNHARFCQSRSLLSITLAFANHCLPCIYYQTLTFH